jgi:hypothetical protein
MTCQLTPKLDHDVAVPDSIAMGRQMPRSRAFC